MSKLAVVSEEEPSTPPIDLCISAFTPHPYTLLLVRMKMNSDPDFPIMSSASESLAVTLRGSVIWSLPKEHIRTAVRVRNCDMEKVQIGE